MKPTEDQLEAALRAASAALPPGDALIMLIVATEEKGVGVVSSASNIDTKATKLHLLELERRNLDAKPGELIQRGAS